MKEFLKNESKIIAVSLAVGVLFALGVAAYTFAYAEVVQRDIAENVIRFHVRAHSDDDAEQFLKDYVKTEILEEFSARLSAQTDIAETRRTLAELLPAMQSHAEETVRRAGFAHEVTAEMTTIFFPTQFYGGIAFPPGMYEAVQIIIGNGTGENWWCLMFPPLCYVDMAATDSGRVQLAQSVSADGFAILTHAEANSPEVVVRFRIVEWWQNRRFS